MNEITINNYPMSIKEYNSQRVVTFKDIDAVHQRPSGTAKRNFNTNRERFIENEDYFVVKPSDFQMDEIRTSEINNYFISRFDKHIFESRIFGFQILCVRNS